MLLVYKADWNSWSSHHFSFNCHQLKNKLSKSFFKNKKPNSSKMARYATVLALFALFAVALAATTVSKEAVEPAPRGDLQTAPGIGFGFYGLPFYGGLYGRGFYGHGLYGGFYG